MQRPTGFAALLASLILILACGSPPAVAITTHCDPTDSAVPPPLEARPFWMGFTRWPPEGTLEGIQRMDRFIAEHGDLTTLHFDGGVPWEQAHSGEAYPSAVMQEWEAARASIPPDHRVYVAITPLDITRTRLAPRWETATNLPLEGPWKEYPLDHPAVREAYLAHARRVVDFFQPDFLAIGIEVNIAEAKSPAVWTAYKTLHRDVYETLKREHPGLTILATFTNSHLNGLDGGDRERQIREIAALMPYSDLFGLSVYPYGWAYGPENTGVTEDLFDLALSFGKPLAVAESGMPSAGFEAFGTAYEFQEEDQNRWMEFLLRQAAEHRFVFVVNWAPIDFDRLLEDLPQGDLRELASFWAFTGLERSDGCPKPALGIWDAYLALPLE